MKKSSVALCALVLSLAPMRALAAPPAPHTFAAANGQFLLDGKPFRILSGEVHYARIPRDQWRQTFRMARAMGLNTITTYVFWNVHEPKPGAYDFNGPADIAEFIREAQQEGLFVILRPGPYACAEWELGGFPAWLLKDKTMPLRTADPRFMQPVKAWFKRLGKELAPLQVGNGGPILLVQVENEYGSYGSDKDYIRAVRSALLDSGFDKAVLYQCDGPAEMPKDALGDMPVGANFGPGKAAADIAHYKSFQTQGPYIVSEYWDGWFDHWGAPWLKTNAQLQAADLEYILTHDSSISLYMFRGGTSFGFMNGANSSNAAEYEPDVTSYDYDSALDESGHPTPKYFLFRDVIARVTGLQPPPVPEVPNLATLPGAIFTSSTPLWSNLPWPVHSEHPLSMEDLGQSFGYILYRTKLSQPVTGTLDLGVMHEYAQVFVDGKLQGTADRRMQQHTVAISSSRSNAQLDILVENTGRINFGPRIVGERIGLLKDASINGVILAGWSIYSLPMEDPAALRFGNGTCTGPCFYRATLQVTQPADTYLDTRELHKGQLWINGRNLGRFWSAGPQGALYLPASWLHSGSNDVVIFDLDAAPNRTTRGLDHEVIDLGSRPKQQ